MAFMEAPQGTLIVRLFLKRKDNPVVLIAGEKSVQDCERKFKAWLDDDLAIEHGELLSLTEEGRFVRVSFPFQELQLLSVENYVNAPETGPSSEVVHRSMPT